ncbi:class I SAM-dependent methyltransferase [Candidatus Shapirobacteria bacterium]|nr:class I SAM-dependent methyltransferase [Candidatus Shapirobacteria bacterium]
MLKTKLPNLFLDFGERPPFGKTFEEINSDTQFAYQIACKYCPNKTVLDYGCGTGHGTEYLSRFTTKQTIGYDISQSTINYASTFFAKPNLSFVIVLPPQKFDLIISFQVVEHIKKADLDKYFQNITSHLNPNGVFILATPNKNITSYKLKTPVFAYHTMEYSPATLHSLLSTFFKKVTINGQIDLPTQAKVKNKQFSYKNMSAFTFKHKLIRYISQIKPFRFIYGHIPQDIKNLILGQTKRITTPQTLVTKKLFIANSYNLIAICQNPN